MEDGLPADWGILVTVEQVKQVLTYSHETIRHLADCGKLKAICSDGTPYHRRAGRRGKRGVRIFASSVAQLLAAVNAEPQEAAATPPGPEPKPEVVLSVPDSVKPRRAGRRKTKTFDDYVAVRRPA